MGFRNPPTNDHAAGKTKINIHITSSEYPIELNQTQDGLRAPIKTTRPPTKEKRKPLQATLEKH